MNAEELGRLVRFAITGGLLAIIYVGLYANLVGAGLRPLTANTLAFGTSVVIQYILQTYWTFRQSLADKRQALRFAVTIGIGLLYSSMVTTKVGPAFEFPAWIAGGAVAVTLPVINFISFRFWVYRKPNRSN